MSHEIKRVASYIINYCYSHIFLEAGANKQSDHIIVCIATFCLLFAVKNVLVQ